jgi:predicted transcriptional regulator
MQMTSFRIGLDSRRRAVGRFVGGVRRELQRAFLEEKAEVGLTQSGLARILGVNRSVVSRQLQGRENLTLETVAEYAWAMRRRGRYVMEKQTQKDGANHVPAMPKTETTPGTEALPALPGQLFKHWEAAYG